MSTNGAPYPAGTPEQEQAELLSILRVFRVAELKELCKNTGLAATGRKLDLIERLEQFIKSLIHSGRKTEVVAVHMMMVSLQSGEPIQPIHRVINGVRAAQNNPQQMLHNGSLQATVRTIMAPGNSSRPLSVHAQEALQYQRQQQQAMHAQTSEVYAGPAIHYRSTVFYSLRSPVGSVQVLKASKARSFKSFCLLLNPTLQAMLRANPRNRLLLFCCAESTRDPGSAVLSYPPVEIYVDGQLTKQSVRGIKGKPGTARPADLTPHFTPSEKPIMVRVVYSDASERYLLHAYVAETYTPEMIMAQVSGKPHISLASTQNAIREENARNAADDIVVENVPLSLRCPITYARIKHPVKSYQCDHVQCFDGLSFLMMQEHIPAWQCPVCSKTVNENSLAVSDFLKDILDKTHEDIDTVLLNTDGSWTPMKEGEEAAKKEESATPNANVKTSEPVKLADDSIEIISLDSDSDEEMSTESSSVASSAPGNGIGTQPSASQPITHNTTVSEPAALEPIVPENSHLANSIDQDTTMNEDVSNDPSDPANNVNSTASKKNSTEPNPHTGTARPEGNLAQGDADSDDENIVPSNHRKRARLSPEPETTASSSRSASDETNRSRETSSIPQPELPAQSNSAGVGIVTNEGNHAASLEDIPISQYLAQRNSQINGGLHKAPGRSFGSPPTSNNAHIRTTGMTKNMPESGRDCRAAVTKAPVADISRANSSQATPSTTADHNAHKAAPTPMSSSTLTETGSNPPQRNDQAVGIPSRIVAYPASVGRAVPHFIQPNGADTANMSASVVTKDAHDAQSMHTGSPATYSSAQAASSAKSVNVRNVSGFQDDTSPNEASIPSTSVATQTFEKGTEVTKDKIIDQVAPAPPRESLADSSNTRTEPRYSARSSTEASENRLEESRTPNTGPKFGCYNGRTDSSIPVVWQNKENHSRSLGRMASSGMHKNTALTLEASVSSGHGSVSLPKSTTHPPESGVSPPKAAHIPEYLKAPSEVSIIGVIQDQITRSCSPRSDSLSDNGSQRNVRGEEAQSQAPAAHGIVSPAGASPRISSQAHLDQEHSTKVPQNSEPRPANNAKHFSPLPTPSSPASASIHESRHHESMPCTRGDQGSHVVSVAAPQRSFHRHLEPSGTTPDSGHSNALVHTRKSTASNEYSVPNRQMQSNAFNDRSGLAPREVRGSSPADYRAIPHSKMNQRHIDLADGFYSTNPPSHDGEVQQSRLQQGQSFGSTRFMNLAHQHNVRMSSDMINAYQRSLSESVLPGGRPHSLIAPAEAGPMRHLSLDAQPRELAREPINFQGTRLHSLHSNQPESRAPVSARPVLSQIQHAGSSHTQSSSDSILRGSNNHGIALPSLFVQTDSRSGSSVENQAARENALAKSTNHTEISTAREGSTGGPSYQFGSSGGARYSKSAFDNVTPKTGPKPTVKGILGIELARDAFRPAKEYTPPRSVGFTKSVSRSPPSSEDTMISYMARLADASKTSTPQVLRSENTPIHPPNPPEEANDITDDAEQIPNTTISPLNNGINDMALHTPTSKKRAISVDVAGEKTWNKRLSRQGSMKTKFNPRDINQSEIIELDD
ncbi:hypothetical protein OXX59_005379 [Metschnikowia pulcherrima]